MYVEINCFYLGKKENLPESKIGYIYINILLKYNRKSNMEGHVIRAKAEKAVPLCWNVNT